MRRENLFVPMVGLSVALPCVLAGAALAGATYSYDALGRIVSVRFDDGKQIVYTYDAAGNFTQTNVSATTVNRMPLAVADAVTLTEDQASVTLNPRANDSDPDGNALTLFSAAGGDFGSAALSGGGTTVTYSSAYKHNAIDKFTYTITDGAGMNSSGEVTVTLANLAPTAVNDSVVVKRNTFALTFDPRSNDTDPGGDTLTITAKSTPAHGTLTISGGGTSLSYSPAANYVGPDPFTYTVSDGDGGIATATVNMSVQYGLSPPVAVNDSQGVVMGNTINFDPRVNDSDDSGPVTITAVTQGAHGTVGILTGGAGVSFAAQAGYIGTDTFTYTIADQDNITATATVTMTASGSNHSPTAVTDTANDDESWPFGGAFIRPTVSINPTVNDTDPDGDPLTVTGKTNGTLGTVTQSGNTLTWTSSNTYGETAFSDSFTYTISDGHGGTATGTVNVNVTIGCVNGPAGQCP